MVADRLDGRPDPAEIEQRLDHMLETMLNRSAGILFSIDGWHACPGRPHSRFDPISRRRPVLVGTWGSLLRLKMEVV